MVFDTLLLNGLAQLGFLNCFELVSFCSIIGVTYNTHKIITLSLLNFRSVSAFMCGQVTRGGGRHKLAGWERSNCFMCCCKVKGYREHYEGKCKKKQILCMDKTNSGQTLLLFGNLITQGGPFWVHWAPFEKGRGSRHLRQGGEISPFLDFVPCSCWMCQAAQGGWS